MNQESVAKNRQLQAPDTMVPGRDLNAYITAVNSVAVLTAEEEQDLADRYYYQEDLEAARKLVLAHLRFVVHIARSYAGYGLAEADLIQEGNVGLMKAVKRFNPEMGVRLVSFAVHWIKAEMHEFILKNWRIVKVATTKAQRKLFFNLRGTRQRLGWMNDHEVEHVAGELGVGSEQVRQMEGRMAARDEAFDGSPDQDDEGRFPANYLQDAHGDPAEIVEFETRSASNRDDLHKAVAGLDERSQEIVRARWLRDNKETLHELADRFGISAERVRQLEQNAFKKLRVSFD